ncbi:MAG: DUF4345 family protein [Halioglobus sp.]
MLKLFLGFTGIIFASYGGYLFIEPQILVDMLDIGDSVPMKVEIRAMYGGLQVGIGLLMLWAVMRTELEQQMAFATLIACFGGLAIGRAGGILIDGGDSYNSPVFIFESASLLISVYGYFKLKRQRAS